MDKGNIKLFYFDIYGRGEAIRLLLHYAKVEYIDERLRGHEFQEMKNKFEFHAVPVLEKDGRLYAQSFAILRYLGR